MFELWMMKAWEPGREDWDLGACMKRNLTSVLLHCCQTVKVTKFHSLNHEVYVKDANSNDLTIRMEICEISKKKTLSWIVFRVLNEEGLRNFRFIIKYTKKKEKHEENHFFITACFSYYKVNNNHAGVRAIHKRSDCRVVTYTNWRGKKTWKWKILYIKYFNSVHRFAQLTSATLAKELNCPLLLFLVCW